MRSALSKEDIETLNELQVEAEKRLRVSNVGTVDIKR